MLTQRDKAVLNYVEMFGVLSYTQIKELFFEHVTDRRCRERLRQLCEQGHLNRKRGGVGMEYMYFVTKKPMQQIEHANARAEFFIKVYKHFDVYDIRTEYPVGNLRPDAYIEFGIKNTIYAAFVEVQLNGTFDQGKYEKLYESNKWRTQWQAFPLIIVITNRPQPLIPSPLKYIILDSEHIDVKRLREDLPERMTLSGIV